MNMDIRRIGMGEDAEEIMTGWGRNCCDKP